MLSRRELLTVVTSAPLLAGRPLPRPNRAIPINFVEEKHTLAIESARGYRSLANIGGNCRTKWIIAPGIQYIDPVTCTKLLERVRSGDWLLLESGLCFASPEHTQRQTQILSENFGLKILPSVLTTEDCRSDSYVSYSWPIQTLVRSFHAVTPVVCAERDVIARFRGISVCLKKEVGLGRIVYLGSMLGPGLMAEERESHAVGNALISQASL